MRVTVETKWKLSTSIQCIKSKRTNQSCKLHQDSRSHCVGQLICMRSCTTSSHLAHKSFRPCEYFGHTAWQLAQFTWSLLRSSPTPRHHGGTLRLFNFILHTRDHVLHSILPSRSDFNYNLRPRRHNIVLTAKNLSITDRDFITRMIYKDFYWCCYIYIYVYLIFPSASLVYCYCL